MLKPSDPQVLEQCAQVLDQCGIAADRDLAAELMQTIVRLAGDEPGRADMRLLLRAVKDRSAGKPARAPAPAPAKSGDPEIRERWAAGKQESGPRPAAPEPRAKPPAPIADTPETYQDRGPVAPSKRRPRVIGGKR